MQDQFGVWIAARKTLVKPIKNGLENVHKYDKHVKILSKDSTFPDGFVAIDESTPPVEFFDCLIPTTVRVSIDDKDNLEIELLKQLLHTIHGSKDHATIFVSRTRHQEDLDSGNAVIRAVQSWLKTISTLSEDIIRDVLNAETWSHQIYRPLVLLGPSTFTSRQWHSLVSTEDVRSKLSELYAQICNQSGCTHLALNAPIPLHGESTSNENRQINVLRSPSGLVPLRGQFGNANTIASQTAFDEALWVNVTQNGVIQTFAPIHTMFSRGNIKEKARILNLAQAQDTPFTAVDLYSGIGYFAFSYAKGGAEAVLGWEINDWSVEGFRRGSLANGWKCRVYQHDDSISLDDVLNLKDAGHDKKPVLAVFAESNELAIQRIQNLRHKLPPVKHVNCGYLPSSQGSWFSAVQCLDPILGGTIHAHENVAVTDIPTRKLEIEDHFRSLVQTRWDTSKMVAGCSHVETVKSYAPGVMHCVFDIAIFSHTDDIKGHRLC